MLEKMYYKVPAEDLFRLLKAEYTLNCIENYDPEFDLNFSEAFDDMPADEEIIEEINSIYNLCK